MGKLVYAAKVSHIPRMILSEKPGPLFGCREDSIQGLRTIGERILSAGADTVVVLDTHWLSNAAYHVNCAPHFQGVFTSSEFPTQIQDLEFDYVGDPDLGESLATFAREAGVVTIAHQRTTLDLEYGTLVPMRFMDIGHKVKVISVSAWLAYSTIEESRRVGQAFRKAIAASNQKVALVASGSLSHRIHDNDKVLQNPYTTSDEFNRQSALRALELWRDARWAEFTAMLPSYARACSGEGWMHDTAMLLGALGWDQYKGAVEVVTPYFVASGTGQINAEFPVQ